MVLTKGKYNNRRTHHKTISEVSENAEVVKFACRELSYHYPGLIYTTDLRKWHVVSEIKKL